MQRLLLRPGDQRIPVNLGEATSSIFNEGLGVVYYADSEGAAAAGTIAPGANVTLEGIAYLWSNVETTVRVRSNLAPSLAALSAQFALLTAGMPPYVLPRGVAGDAALQTAEIHAAMASSSEVYLPPGAYPASGLTGVSNTRLRGSGPGTIIIGDVNVPSGVTNFHLSDLQVLTGNILFTDTTRCSVRRVRSDSAPGRGITFMGGSNFDIEDNELIGGLLNLIEIQNASWFSVQRNNVDGPTHADWQGIATNNCTHFTVNNNRVRNSGFIGIALGNDCDYATVSGNLVHDTGGNAIDTGSCTNVSITGNEVSECVDGIDCDLLALPIGTLYNITITGNVINDCTKPNLNGYGITVGGASGHNVTISGNSIRRTKLHGILAGNIDGLVISGNTVYQPGIQAPGYSCIYLFSGGPGVGCRHSTVIGNTAHDAIGHFGINKGVGAADQNDFNVYVGNNMVAASVGYGGTAGPNDVAANNL